MMGNARLLVLVGAALLAADAPAYAQTIDATDVRLAVDYCLGTRIALMAENQRDQIRDCSQGSMQSLCDTDKMNWAYLDREASRLRLYLLAHFKNGEPGLVDVGAVQRGAADANALSFSMSKCSQDPRHFAACMTGLAQSSPTLSGSEERIRRCKQVLDSLPF